VTRPLLPDLAELSQGSAPRVKILFLDEGRTVDWRTCETVLSLLAKKGYRATVASAVECRDHSQAENDLGHWIDQGELLLVIEASTELLTIPGQTDADGWPHRWTPRLATWLYRREEMALVYAAEASFTERAGDATRLVEPVLDGLPNVR